MCFVIGLSMGESSVLLSMDCWTHVSRANRDRQEVTVTGHKL